ncbi:Predicted membrane protein [Canicola haemoglobinophilus]|uniref:Predicted membrane protein n=1 Tax=Canicola haemoglobinophilus TaxID=733 RepID=A0AB38H742_9PAST|nr:DUF805 domain-containing protein [Canicola haemoglobinophilus]STO55604.1 Predicted membrane protein [Canicola haemoglobinophilus]STO67930.1 Predicted membrane protein [Canicola haemoglobinophilus]
MNTLKTIWNFFFGFKGRINQYYYLILILFTIPLPYIIHVLSITWDYVFYNTWTVSISPSDWLLNIVITTIMLFMFLIAPIFWILFKYSLLVRRSHDFNGEAKSTPHIMLIAFTDILTILPLFIAKLPFNLHISAWLISSVLAISLAFIKGDEGDNNFGSPQLPFWKSQK